MEFLKIIPILLAVISIYNATNRYHESTKRRHKFLLSLMTAASVLYIITEILSLGGAIVNYEKFGNIVDFMWYTIHTSILSVFVFLTLPAKE